MTEVGSGIHKVCLVAIRDRAIATAVAQRLADEGASAYGPGVNGSAEAQLTAVLEPDPVAAKAAITDFEQRIAPVDVLAFDGPLPSSGAFIDAKPADIQQLLGDALLATVQLFQAVGARMVDRGSGRIVYVARSSTLGVADEQILHASVDAAVIRLCLGAAGEWATQGVRVNVVSAGHLRTDVEQVDLKQARIPIRRIGEADDVAKLVAHLATGVDFVTGAVVGVDGGVSAKS